MEGLNEQHGKILSGLGSGPGEGLRARQPPCGFGLGEALQLPKSDFAGALWVFQAPLACTVRRVCGRAAHDHHGYPARVEVELLASTDRAAGRTE